MFGAEAGKAQPLAEKSTGESPGLWVSDHALHLSPQCRIVTKFARIGERAEFVIWHGHPEKVAQAIGELMIIELASTEFIAKDKARRSQRSGEGER